MIAKISLALLVILNIYVVAAVSKASRQDIGHNLKLIPSRIKGLMQRVRHDDNQEVSTEPLQREKTSKMDFSEQCKEGGVKCDGGMNCWNENSFKISQCRAMDCECSLCMYGVCPPAQKGIKG